MAAECVWLCGRDADTDEDIVSKWLRKQVGKRRFSKSQWGVRNIDSLSGNPVEYRVPHKDTSSLGLKASKIACRTCNNEWMSRAEGRAKPGLTRLVRDEKAKLGPSERSFLGTWGAMKGILLAYADRPQHQPLEVEAAARQHFGKSHSPASNTTVYMARISPAELAFTVYTARLQTRPDRAVRAYIASLSLRSVVFLTFVGSLHRWESERLTSEPGRLLQVWPTLELTWEDWPPIGPSFATREFVDFVASVWRP